MKTVNLYQHLIKHGASIVADKNVLTVSYEGHVSTVTCIPEEGIFIFKGTDGEEKEYRSQAAATKAAMSDINQFVPITRDEFENTRYSNRVK